MKKRYAIGLCLLGVAAAGLAARRARAQDVTPMVPAGPFSMVGAARGETARLNITNVNTVPPDVCRATLAFVDGNGDVLRRPDGTPLQRDVVLEAGHSAFLQVNAGSMLGRGETRLDVRPVVLSAPPDPITPDPCVSSVEIIQNTTGRTRLLVPGSIRTYTGNHNETLVEDR